MKQFVMLLLSSLLIVPSALPQGSLTPPAAPTPTMKTLDQVQPRTPIGSVPFTVNAPGSYYLTQNVSVSSGDAIDIAASGVQLDLNGFTISSTGAAGSAVSVFVNLHDVTVKNGHIVGGIAYDGTSFSGSGFSTGVRSSIPVRNVLVQSVTVSGCTEGINLGLQSQSTTVKDCLVSVINGNGIRANVVLESIAQTCNGAAIWAQQAANCTADSVGSAGLTADNATNCRATTSAAAATGMSVTYNAQNCYGLAVGGIGLLAVNATNCVGQTTTGTGLSALNGGGGVASFCRGIATGNGTGLNATIAIGCTGSAGAGGTAISTANKFLMP